jgi:hypothetical protein
MESGNVLVRERILTISSVPGVRLMVTVIIPVQSSASLIRVTAGFQYDASEDYPHTARRSFPIQGNQHVST